MRLRREPHDGGHHLRRGTQRTDAIDLLDAVLQCAHHRAVVAEPRQPRRGVPVLGVLDRKQHHIDGPVDIGRVGVHRTRHDDRVLVVRPDLQPIARCVPAEQHLMACGVQQCGHGGADRPWADDSNTGSQPSVFARTLIHTVTLPADSGPLHCGSRLVRPFPGRFFVLRSHAAGSLRATDAGQKVTLAGWVARRRDHGGVIFIDLRDASGISQVVFRDADVLAAAHRLRAEFCIAVEGVVEVRPEGNANAEIATGDIEVNATSLTVLGESAPLPFQLDEVAGEETRLKYRYLDLRREGPATAMRLRSKVNAAARGVWARHDFVEIASPTMTRPTPEGARDFLVPARLQPGSFYALPQSPQLFKQL